ncbi:MAG: hypothetical protein ACYDEX_17495 [Mobilitalea sp.]
MLGKFKILCFIVFLSGIGLFFITTHVLSDTSPALPWCIGLACALIILGLGYYINFYCDDVKSDKAKHKKSSHRYEKSIGCKEKAGYLVCKIMNILLCIYLLLLNALKAEPLILFVGIGLVLIQYSLDLTLQIYYANRKEK